MPKSTLTLKAEKLAGGVSVFVLLYQKCNADDDGRFPINVRISYKQKNVFIRTGAKATPQEYEAICIAEIKASKKYVKERQAVCKTFNAIFDAAKAVVEAGENVSVEAIKSRYLGIKETLAEEVVKQSITLYSLWRNVAGSKSVGTEQSYMNAYNRFIADMGENVTFEQVNKEFIEKWATKMQRLGVSKSTVNIYLRALRVVINEAVEQGFMEASTKSLFKKMKVAAKDWGAIGGKNSYTNRKKEYMDVETWRELWQFYISRGEGNEAFQSWRIDRREKRLEALGMMLFMYLADGMNLRDVLNLRYDDFYFAQKRKRFCFIRQKVADRTAAEIMFPVLPEIRTILDTQALPEKRGGLVFGYLQGKVTLNSEKREDIAEERRLTALYNSYIRESMSYITDAMGIDVKPTPTYCRHSFASNLTQAGVPKEYISASMGHSGSSTTDNYIDTYSYKQMVDYNSRLLASPADKDKSRLKALLQSMSMEEIKVLLND